MTRFISGVLLAATFFALVWFSSATVLLFVALAVGILAFQEFAQMTRPLGAEVPKMPALLATLAAVAIVPFPYVAGEAVVGMGVALIAVGAMTKVARGIEFRPAASGAIAGGFAAVYIGLPLGALVGVHIFGGRGAVMLLVATIVISDTAQYYAGRTFGRHPLAPRLSPKKTIEGAIGGFVVAPLFLYFAGPYLVPVATPLLIAPLGIVLVAAGIAGDLFESMIKRAAEMKDSSALIPGHGGVLDRIDALLFATPVFYAYLRWLYTA
ncbi:MAG: phosphatidate cytidylyltransferase [Acidobacteria bacterium]|nr:phosphatidate cytidylyltransferase [Acidobacteriota bacterium]